MKRPLPDSLERELRRVCGDHLSGSTALAARAARLLEKAARAGAARQAARRLLSAHPRMASMRYVVDRALIDGVCAAGEVLRASRDSGERAAAVIPEGATVLTHSASSAVFAALTRVAGIRVIATESRPNLEGVKQARELRKLGIDVELIVDSAAGLHMARADFLLTGADAVTRAGVINKIGTAALVRAAMDQGVPRYAVCGSDKILPPGLALPPEKPKPASEIARGIRASNYYFEETPLDWWTAIITEHGPFP